MFKQQKIHELDDFFLNLGLRPGKGVFFTELMHIQMKLEVL